MTPGIQRNSIQRNRVRSCILRPSPVTNGLTVAAANPQLRQRYPGMIWASRLLDGRRPEDWKGGQPHGSPPFAALSLSCFGGFAQAGRRVQSRHDSRSTASGSIGVSQFHCGRGGVAGFAGADCDGLLGQSGLCRMKGIVVGESADCPRVSAPNDNHLSQRQGVRAAIFYFFGPTGHPIAPLSLPLTRRLRWLSS